MTDILPEAQRERRRKQAHTVISNALAASWTEWRRTGRKPDFTVASHYAMDGLGDLAAEILADGTMLKGFDIKDGVVTIETEPARELLLVMVASLREMLDSYGAENYLETEIVANDRGKVAVDLQDGQNPTDSYTVTIQRRYRPTPHEFRQKAEARVTELESIVANARKLIDAWLSEAAQHHSVSTIEAVATEPLIAGIREGAANQYSDCANELRDVLDGEDPDSFDRPGLKHARAQGNADA